MASTCEIVKELSTIWTCPLRSWCDVAHLLKDMMSYGVLQDTNQNTQLIQQFSGVVSASSVNHQVSQGLEIMTFAVFMAVIMSLRTRKIRFRTAQEI